MNYTETFRKIWWFILVLSLGYFIFMRKEVLLEGESTVFDIVVFLVWISICLAPIFKEMNIFGVKLKHDIEELKRDMEHKISLMKNELKSSIEVSSANTNQVLVNNNPEPLRDSEIDQFREILSGLGIAPSGNSGDSILNRIRAIANEYTVPRIPPNSISFFARLPTLQKINKVLC